MSFSVDIPRNLESPGNFPTQCRTNWSRLKTIINADHVFNDTAQANDGIHRQVTMVNRDPSQAPPILPGVLPAGANGMLYSFLDSQSRTQLAFYNGTVINQLTPTNELFSFIVTGKVIVPANNTALIYAYPGFNYTAVGMVVRESTNIGNSYFLFDQNPTPGASGIRGLLANGNTGPGTPPELTYPAGDRDLYVRNGDSNSYTLVWSLNVVRSVQ